MNSPIEEIKARLDIVELIQGYIRLQKAGINYKANCPFHGEKTPSFFVSPTRQIWHCFGCSKGGDMFKFVMEMEGHDFPEALKLLAGRAGVVLKREDPRIMPERNRLYDVCEAAAEVFETSRVRTPAVIQYLAKRGMTDETIKNFRIGFAPQSWDFLIKALSTKGFKALELEKAGLAVKSQDSNSWYDRFRSRIMFPITDANARVIGFGGRIFGDDHKKEEAKYVNTPQTVLYDKSRVLYGFDRAKQAIREKNTVVVVEGYMDCVMSHQAGVTNTIAVSGTALTPDQLKVVKRLAGTMVSSFDADAAGDSATKRSLALASSFDFERRIAHIPSGKDPADAVLENPEVWRATVADAQQVVEFYFDKALRQFDFRSVDGKKSISRMLLPYMRELTNEIEKAHWVGQLANRLQIPEASIWKELAVARNENPYQYHDADTKQEQKIQNRRELVEERLLALLSVVDEETKRRELPEVRLVFASDLHQKLFDALSVSTGQAVAPELQNQVELLRFKGEVLSQMTEHPGIELRVCSRELAKETIRERLVAVGIEIQKLEKEGKTEALAPLLQNFKELSQKLSENSVS